MTEILVEIVKIYMKEFLYILIVLWIVSYFVDKIEFFILNFKK